MTNGSPLGDTFNGRSLVWIDFDGDGDQDLYLTLVNAPNRLLRNDGGNTFVNVAGPPINFTASGPGATAGDYDNDGDVDLYVTNQGSANKLFRNDGGGTFADATTGVLAFNGNSRNVTWIDYDRDGDLDLYLLKSGAPSSLFRNDAGVFANVTGTALAVTATSPGQGTWGDFDNDGDQDVYVPMDGANKLFRNDGGGAFADVTNGPLGDTDQASLGAAWGDYDNDGDLDLYLTNFSSFGNKMLRNDGGASATFVDVTGWPSDPAVNDSIATNPGNDNLWKGISDGAGGLIAVWEDNRKGTDPDIYVHRMNSKGKPLWALNGVAVCSTSDQQYSPDIALDGTGGVIVVWQDLRNISTTGRDLYAQRMNASGTPQWISNGKPVCTTSGDQAEPAIISDGAGGAFIVWSDLIAGKVFAQRLNAAGDPQWAPNGVALSGVAGGSALSPKICSDGSTGAIIAWYDQRSGQQNVYAQRVNSSGTLLWNPDGVKLSNGGVSASFVSAILPDGSGGGLIAWSVGSTFSRDVYTQRVNSSGSPLWGTSGATVCTAPESQNSPKLASDGTGGATVVWDDNRTGSSVEIYAQRMNASGVAQWATDGIPIRSGGQNGSQKIIGDGAGGAIISWSDLQTDYDIYAQRVNASGTALWAANGVPVCTATESQYLTSLIPNGTGSALAVWQDGRNAIDTDIYAQEINASGSLGDPLLGSGGFGAGVTWGDYDLDGDLDMYLASGNFPTVLLRNEGSGRFENVTTPPLGEMGGNPRVSFADYDNDGDLDVYQLSFTTHNKLFRNDQATTNKWLKVVLQGTVSNRSGIGARVRAVSGSLKQIRDVSAGSGYLSQNPFPLTFGFGTTSTVDTLEIRWPSGIVQRMTNVSTNQVLQVQENAFADVTSGPLGDEGQGQGVAWGDYDGDGDLDLYLANFGSANKLFRNDDGSLADATSGPLGIASGSQAVAWGDFDNDGDLDLYLSRWGQSNKLFRNDGGAGFVDATSGPLGYTGLGAGVAWADYDRDGDLDLYLGNWGEPNKLFRNDGGGTFVDATSGPLGDTGSAVGVAWGDYDQDGDPDLYVANRGQANKLFRNDGVAGFVDATIGPLGDTGNGQGFAWGDYDNDGDLDIYLANGPGANKLFRNDGNGAFVDATSGALGVAGDGVGVAWGDYDNDGDLDLFLSRVNTPLLRNEGGGVFVNATTPVLQASGTGSGVAWGDYDQDGDLDVYLSVFGSANHLFRNENANGNHWLQVKLVGTVSNRSGIGARVRAVTGSLKQVQEVSGGSGYLSQNSLPVEFGLGAATTVDTLEIRWPSGIRQWFTGVSTNQVLSVTEEASFTDATTGALSGTGKGLSLAWGDYDNDGDQDLYLSNDCTSPNKLLRNDGGLFADVTASPLNYSGCSRGVAWGDYDNDGDLDLYVTNDNGEPSKLFRNNGGGVFADVSQGPISATRWGQGVSWGDYDQDGDLDLFVPNGQGPNKLIRNDASTFVDATTGPLIKNNGTVPQWVDFDNDNDLDVFVGSYDVQSAKLYRNDGNGVFADVTTVPLADAHSGDWADFDNDGDLDVFIAGGPGTESRLLRNEGQLKFVSVLAGSLVDGSILDAWGDYDNDGDLDLFTTNAQGTNRLLRNDAGTFVDATSGGVASAGQTYGAAWADYDQDGDLDLYFATLNGSNKLLRNETTGAHWLQVRLRGSASNRSAIGARVRTVAGSLKQWRDVSGGAGYAQNALTAQFGLGTHTLVDTLEVRWPSGRIQRRTSVAVDQVLIIQEADFTDVTPGLLGQSAGRGVAWADYDRDGDLDLYLARSASGGAANKLFRNEGSGVFIDATNGPLGNTAQTIGAAWGDYDQDGDLDLYLANFTDGPSKLLRNDGGNTFADVTPSALAIAAGTQGGVAWGDYDQDGDLDLFVTVLSSGCKLFRNDGGGLFADITPPILVNAGTQCEGAAWGDYDNDRDPDLYLTIAVGGSNKLYRNDNGTFANATSGALGQTGEYHGVAWGDYDQDGDLDLYLGNHNGANKLLRNDGNGVFADVTTGVLGLTGTTLSVAWADYDLDGDLDLTYTSQPGTNKLLRNDGGGFANVTFGPFEVSNSAWGTAWGDYDNDGDLDLYIADDNASRLFRNEAANGNHWLRVNLAGSSSNRFGVGAHIRVRTGSTTQLREVSASSGYNSYDAITAAFGLGSSSHVDTLEVRWPSGKNSVLTSVQANQTVTVSEPLSAPAQSSFALPVWISPTDAGTVAGQMGTAVASAGDVNGDGYDDALIGSMQGKVVLFLGGPTSDDVPDLVLRSESPDTSPYEHFGEVLSGAGDVNKDGYDDWIVGATGHGAAGRAYLYFGSAALNGVADVIMDGQVPGDQFGASVAGVGDLNQDGYKDWAVAAASNDAGGTDAGRVYVYFGSSNPDGNADLSFTGIAAQGFYARKVAGKGDVNGDGFDDVLVGAQGSEQARVFLGGPVVNSVADLVIPDPAPNVLNDFGRSLSILGDVNGDGFDDIAVEARNNPSASMKTYVFMGGATLNATVDLTLSTPGNSAISAALGDVNADGYADFAVGDAEASSGGRKGAVSVYYGRKVLTTTPDITLRGETNTSSFGSAVAGNADVNKDGIADLLVGDPVYSVPPPPNGRGYVFLGTSLWPSPTELATTDGNGVAWADYDKDGDLDVYVSRFTAGSPKQLWRNDGSGTFVNVTAPPVNDNGAGRGLAWADYDNDGDLDLYISNSGTANKLFRNDGGGTFADVTGVGVLTGGAANRGVAWVDIDNDGDLDLYQVISGGNVLARNDAGVFVNATGSPLNNGGHPGRAAAFGDVDNDGDLDLYLVNVSTANKLLRNDGPAGFVDISALNPAAADAGAGMGATFGDYDNDGDQDLYLVNDSTANVLLRNDGGTFVAVTGSGVAPLFAAGPANTAGWADFDNDGDLDVYLTQDTGTSKLFRNEGSGQFVSTVAGSLSSGERGAAWGDYDQDGDLDILTANASTPIRVIRNDSPLANRWLQINLTGRLSNRSGVGARIRAVSGTKSQIRDVGVGDGFFSQGSLATEFGFGATATVDTLEIRWPSGIVQVLTAVATNQVLNVTESQFSNVPSAAINTSGDIGAGIAWGDYDGDGDEDAYVTNSATCRLFRNDSGGTAFANVTPLILQNATGNGQGVAWGDYDNDGDLDLFVGNSANGGAGADRLFRNDGAEVFVDLAPAAMTANGTARGAAWADYDKDGDLDLFQANTGGNNRLFRNDGSGLFVNVANTLLGDGNLQHIGVAWADYDNDRDLDLYLANTSGNSRLFRNDAGTFVNVASGTLAAVGNAPAWGDYDNDGDLDLFVAVAAGNRLFRNDGGSAFVDVANAAVQNSGQTNFGGMWADVDLDGDLDLFVNATGTDRLLRNDAGTFVNATHGSLGSTGTGRGAAWADIDQDGDLDLYSVTTAADTLLRNISANQNHWMRLKLVGTTSNKSAIGARVRVKTGSKAQIREVEGGSGYLSQNSLILQFGLGKTAVADTVEIKWPSGTTQILKNITGNQNLTVTEPAAGPDIVSIDKTATPNVGSCVLVITGLRLDLSGANVSLTGPATIPGTVTAQSGTSVTATFNVAAAVVGSYNVSFINSLGSDVLTGVLIVHSSGIALLRSTQSSATDTDPAIPRTTGLMDTMVFVSTRGGAANLYLKNPILPDTAPLTALTTLGSVANPSFSGDGRKVVFENAGSLYILNLQTLAAPTVLTSGLEPEWSPVSDVIAYRKSLSGGRFAVFTIHADGTGGLQLTNPTGVTIDSNPTWSPDGKRIAYLRDASGTGAAPVLRVTEASGGDGIVISNLAGIRDVSWSPQGRWIAASTNGSGNFRLYLVGSSGQGTLLLSADATQDTKPCWNADGTQLAYTSTYSGNPDIYVLSAISGLTDTDQDLVPDPLDACANTAPAIGQIDRDFNGCGDPSSSFRMNRFWNPDQLPLMYQTTANGDPRIADNSEFVSLQDAFNAWTSVPGVLLSGGDDGTHGGPVDVIAGDGKNSITFGDKDGYIAGTLAVTLSTVAEEDTVVNGRWYRPGEIVDADVLFNANDFHFSTATTVPTPDSYDLRAVATHEFGHFFGMSHSVVKGSTMYVVVPRNTSAESLEKDDTSLLRRGYAADTTRSVDGRVLRGDGSTPVVGAVVMAIASSAPMDTLQMTLTDVNGRYRFFDLDRSFRIFVTPLDGGDGVNDITASYINSDLVPLAETIFPPEYWDGGSETNHDTGLGVVTTRPGPLVSNANIILNVDVTPPSVVSTIPAQGSTTASVSAALIIQFSEKMNFSTVDGTDISLRNIDLNTGVGGVAAGLNDNTVIGFTPSGPLAYSTNYKLTIRAAINDVAGNTLADSTVVTFRTQAQPGVSLTSLSPGSAAPGCAIVIQGSGFNPNPGQNSISFGGVPVTPTAATLERLYAIVPPGATTGTVTVTVAANTSNGLAFTVLAPRAPPSANRVGEKSFSTSRPVKIDIAPDGSYVYVATTTGVSAVPTIPSSLTGITAQISITGGCVDVVAMADGDHALAIRSISPELQVLDTSVPGSLSVAKQVPLGGEPLGLAVVPGGTEAVVSFANKLALISTPSNVTDPQFGRIVREWTYDNGPFLGPISLSRDGTRIFAATGDNHFAVFNETAGGTSIGSLRSGSPRETIAVPDGGSALGVDLEGNILTFDNLGTVRTVLAGGGGYASVAVSPEGEFGYAADLILNRVDVLDLSVAKTAIIASFDTGIDPLDIIASPDGSTVYVLTGADRKLEAYDTIDGPFISSVSPSSGGPGTLITLSGTNFNPTPSQNYVSMGGVVLTPISASPSGTSLVVKQTALVTEGHIAVTTGGNTSNLVEYGIVNQTDPGNFALAASFSANVTAGQSTARAPSGRFVVVRGSDGTLSMLGEAPLHSKYHRLIGSLSPSASGLTGPGPLVITPDGTTLFAGNRNASRIMVYTLDPDATTPIVFAGLVQNGTAPAILDPASMAITPDGKRLYVASAADARIVEIAVATRAVSASITGSFTQPTAIDIHPFGKRAYVLLNDGVSGIRVGVFNIDPASVVYRTRVASVPLTGSSTSMQRVFALPSGNRMCALVGSGSVYRLKLIDSDSTSVNYNHEIGSLQVGSGPGVPVMAPNQSGTFVFVADPGGTTLRPIDVSSFTFTADLITNAGLASAQSVLTSDDDTRLYVTSGGVLLQTDLTTAGSLVLVSGKDQVGVENEPLTFPITVRSAAGSSGAAVTFEAVGGGSFGDSDAFGYAALDANGVASATFNPGIGMGIRTVKAKLSGVTIQTTVTVLGDTALVPVQVVSTSPATNITLGVLTSVGASFSKGVNPATVDTSSFPVRRAGTTVAGTYLFSDHERRITFVPSAPLSFSSTYTAQLTAAIKDYNGNPLDNPASFSFQTETLPTSVTLSALSPSTGIVGAPVVISGDGFEATTTGNSILFGSIAAVVERADNKALVTHVPDGAGSGTVKVSARSQTSNSLNFEVIVPSPQPVRDLSADVPVPTSGNQVVVTPDEVRAYMTSPEGNSVVPILLNTLMSENPVPVGIYPLGIAISPDGKRSYVANYYSGDVSVIDTDASSGTFQDVVNTILIGSHPIAAAVNPNGRELYVVSAGSTGDVVVIDTDPESNTYTAKKTIETGSSNQTVTVTADGGQLIVGTANGIVLIDISGDDAGAKTTIETGSGTKSVTVTPDGGFALVLTTTGSLLLIDIRSGSSSFGTAKKTIETGSSSQSVTVSSDGGTIYVSTSDGHILIYALVLSGEESGAVADLSNSGFSMTPVDTVSVGENLAGLAFVNQGKLLVVDSGARSVLVLGTGPTWIACNGTTVNYPGTLLQSELKDTLTVVMPGGAIQLRSSLSWTPTSGTNLDFALYRRTGTNPVTGTLIKNVTGSALPETLLVQGLAAGTYFFEITRASALGTQINWTVQTITCAESAIGTPEPAPVLAYRLLQSFPNPFRAGGPPARIRFALAQAGNVRLDLYDARGALVRTLVHEWMDRGEHEAMWDGRTEQGTNAASGVYFYRFEVKTQFVKTRRMLLLR